MGLISGMTMGLILGVVFMACWQRLMRYRSIKRIAKVVQIKLLTSLGRDDLNRICGDTVPEWISFPAYQQVKWLNKQLIKLWPFIADAAELVIKESVEPLLEEYRPPGISALKFNKLTLGTVAPKVEGIRVQSLKPGQITMDMDFKWGGDPDIILGVQAAHVASIPIQFKDLKVFTKIRLIFQLAEEIPCISAVLVALLSEPKPIIDYTLKAVGGSLTAIPGISDMIDDTVESIVADTLQWPHRIVVPLGGIPVDTSELELKPQGKLSVTVVRANDLKNLEIIGKSDPYTVLFIRTRFKRKTKVIKDNLNPVWNEAFDLIAEDIETQSLILEVFDQDIGEDKKLGVAKLALADLEDNTFKEFEMSLLPALDMTRVKDKKDRGTITIKVRLIFIHISLVETFHNCTTSQHPNGIILHQLELKVMYHAFNIKEQYEAMDEEKKELEEKKKLKEEGVIGSTMDALDDAAGVVGAGIGAVGTSLSKAGRFMGRTITRH